MPETRLNGRVRHKVEQVEKEPITRRISIAKPTWRHIIRQRSIKLRLAFTNTKVRFGFRTSCDDIEKKIAVREHL